MNENTSAKTEEFDVMAEMSAVYEKIGEDLTVEAILSMKDDIARIAAQCELTGIFKSSKDRHNAVVAELESLEDKDQRIVFAWNLHDSKVANAPTSLHARGAATLLIPIINKAIQMYA